MRTIPPGFADTSVTDLHVCFLITRRDSVTVLGTECDQDITITTGTYAGTYPRDAAITGSDIRSTSDLAVDNLEIQGAMPNIDRDSSSASLTVLDLTPLDIENGLYDNAEIVIFLVNSKDPDLYQHVLRTGWLGNTTRKDPDGGYRAEMRGLTQALSQGIVRTYSVGCDAELGDARCKVDMAAHTFNRTVTVATSRRAFEIDTTIAGTQIVGGKVIWTSGANEGALMEIKSFSGVAVELYLPMAADIDIGDTLTIRRGCDKQQLTCINSYNNIRNFRGHAIFVPGQFEILKVGKK